MKKPYQTLPKPAGRQLAARDVAGGRAVRARAGPPRRRRRRLHRPGLLPAHLPAAGGPGRRRAGGRARALAPHAPALRKGHRLDEDRARQARVKGAPIPFGRMAGTTLKEGAAGGGCVRLPLPRIATRTACGTQQRRGERTCRRMCLCVPMPLHAARCSPASWMSDTL